MYNFITTVFIGSLFWLSLFLIYPVFGGFISLKSKMISLHRLLLIAAFFIVYSCFRFALKYSSFFLVGAFFPLGLLVGCASGWLFFSYKNVLYSSKTNYVFFQEKSVIFLSYVWFLAFKFAVEFGLSFDPLVRGSLAYLLVDVISSGIMAGFFSGGWLYVFYYAKIAPHSKNILID